MAKQLPQRFADANDARHWIELYQSRLGEFLAGRLDVSGRTGTGTGLFVQSCMLTVMESPSLLSCSALSILGCLFKSAQLALAPGGVLGHAWIVPYKGTATYQMGYKGYIVLGKRERALMHGQIVFPQDKFSAVYGIEPRIVHEPDWTVDRSESAVYNKDRRLVIRGAYAVIRYSDGRADYEFLTAQQIEARRASSQAWRSNKPDTPWRTHPGEMARSRPFCPLGKRSGLGDVQLAATLDDYADAGAPQRLDWEAAQITGAVPTSEMVAAVEARADAREPIRPPQAKAPEPNGEPEQPVPPPDEYPKPEPVPNEPPKKSRGKSKSPEPVKNGNADPPETVSGEERKQILDALFAGAAGDEQRQRSDDFRERFGIKSTADLSADKFEEAMAAAREIAGGGAK